MRKNAIEREILLAIVIGAIILVILFIFLLRNNYNNTIDNFIPGFNNSGDTNAQYTYLLKFSLDDGSLKYHTGSSWHLLSGNSAKLSEREINPDEIRRTIEEDYLNGKRAYSSLGDLLTASDSPRNYDLRFNYMGEVTVVRGTVYPGNKLSLGTLGSIKDYFAGTKHYGPGTVFATYTVFSGGAGSTANILVTPKNEFVPLGNPDKSLSDQNRISAIIGYTKAWRDSVLSKPVQFRYTDADGTPVFQLYCIQKNNVDLIVDLDNPVANDKVVCLQ